MHVLRLCSLCRSASVVARHLAMLRHFLVSGLFATGPFFSFFLRDRAWRDQPSPGRSSNQNPLDLQAMEC
jgi:hypothetical protein